MGRKAQPYKCKKCNCTDSSLFYQKPKSLCKTCISIRNVNTLHLKSFNCMDCSDTTSTNFYQTHTKRCIKCTSIHMKGKYTNLRKQFPDLKLTDEQLLDKLTKKKEYSKKYGKLYQQKHLIKYRVAAAKQRCAQRNLPFNISEDFIKDLWVKQEGKCYYSGIPMVMEERNHPHGISLERIDSNGGYTTDNVVLCSSSVNTMKLDLPKQEFLHIIKAIHDYNKL